MVENGVRQRPSIEVSTFSKMHILVKKILLAVWIGIEGRKWTQKSVKIAAKELGDAGQLVEYLSSTKP